MIIQISFKCEEGLLAIKVLNQDRFQIYGLVPFLGGWELLILYAVEEVVSLARDLLFIQEAWLFKRSLLVTTLLLLRFVHPSILWHCIFD